MDRTRGVIGRAQRAVAGYGLTGLAQEASRRARTWAHRPEEHLWWERDLGVQRTPHPMPDGFALSMLPERDVRLAANLRMVNFGAAVERYRRGGEFWVVRRDEWVAFGVWMFPSMLPVHAAPGGWVAMPSGVIGMEDGAVDPEASRLNIALPALDHIAEHYRERGAHAIVAKTAVTNRPVFVLLTRAGYRRAARMDATFAGPLRWAELSEVKGAAMAALEPALTGGAVSRARRAQRRHGTLGAARALGAPLAHRAYHRERHVWWELDLSTVRRARPLRPGLRFAELLPEQMHRVRTLSGVDADAAGERRAAGGTFWAVVDGDEAVFGAWTFPDRMPASAAADGWVPVPDGYVGIDGAVTAEPHRRRGIAAAGLTVIADRLAEQGHHRVVVKSGSGDGPVARLLETLGYRRAAVMNSVHVGSLTRVRVTAGAAPSARVLAEAIG